MGMGSFVTFPNHKVGVYENGTYAQITILVRTIIMRTHTQGITIYIYIYIIHIWKIVTIGYTSWIYPKNNYTLLKVVINH